MITRLHIENFKSWRDTGELRFAPLTGLFGANSSGKTAILQFLLMLKQTVDSPDRKQVLNFGDERRDPVVLGTFPDVVFQHKSLPLRWRIEFESFSFEAEIIEGARRTLEVAHFEYQEENSVSSARKRDEGDYKVEVKAAGSERDSGMTPTPPTKFYGFPPVLQSLYLEDQTHSFEDEFAQVYYLGPLRDYPRREYSWTGSRPSGVGKQGERAVDALLAARLAGQAPPGSVWHVTSLEEQVARWLHKLGLVHEFRIDELGSENLYRVRVRRTPASPEVLLTEVGFGVSQILPVLVLCYYAPEGSILILEQPEIHLHPSVQAGLADVLIDAIQKRGIQILLESHSEYLLNRLQRRIAEENGFTQEDVALYFCSIEDGESRATPLEVDPFGNITNWPRDFFGDEMGDLAARTRAEMERRKAKAG